MNELSIILNRNEYQYFEVLEAAATKWNFLKFAPGLVGCNCIGVDPYYLSYKAKAMGYHPRMIDSGRAINDGMGRYIGKQTVKKIIAQGMDNKGARVLVMGITFKEDVSDIRNSKVVDIIKELKEFDVDVDVIDPKASAEEVDREYGIKLLPGAKGRYDAIILAVSHKQYKELDEKWFSERLSKKGIVIDVKGVLRNKIRISYIGVCNLGCICRFGRL